MSRKNRFKGYSINDIINISFDEFASLNKSELRQAVSRLASTANKRLQRLSKNDLVSPAQIEANESGGKFSTKGKSELELQVEYRRVSNFLTQRTSTVTGARQMEEETRQVLAKQYGIELSKDDYRQMLTGYNQIMNESPEYVSRKLRYKYLRDMDMTLADNHMTTTDISDAITSMLTRYYSAGGTQYDGTSNYFGFD